MSDNADEPICISAAQARLLTEDDLPGREKEDEGDVKLSNSDNLWAYRSEHQIQNVQVRQSDWDLPIADDETLAKAFRLHSVPHSEMFWMSPDDEESMAKYNQILQAAYDGKIIIVDEQKQYDQSKGKFLVWLRYDEVAWELHPRYEFIREERK